ncbi:phosphoglucomutase/phosphomannomutase [Halalkaliarchaeum desulfuricum]|uniref:Phosphoglucomutase/phosphomannomutase n=1 Tax=Halalkaliarchaeum desulfuricum TaxID=2055893 RepID=A0A343TJT2_9EURY|nr:phosphoglucomutase/phosphomannomutase family protein [Halalkaliarchaeum desulfuricum]AUX09354.1 phosphoglucomutase/phosphomannomutase [Halalkaliarchaeum desulfuricum]
MDTERTDADAISFGTDGWRAPLGEFTDRRLRLVARAIADHLRAEETDGPVAVGYDARESSPGFAETVAETLAGEGFDVLFPERDVPTPVIAHAVVDRGCAGAVVITASHNPPEYNGVKFIPDDGAPALPAVTDDIESRLGEAPGTTGEREDGRIRRFDPIEPHRRAVRRIVDADLDGVAVVYDAMHGSGRGVTDALLSAAGATVIRRRCSRDPDFGGGGPDPVPERLGGLVADVREQDADLGIANDGDADRIAIVTPEGHLDANRFFAATYEALLSEDVLDSPGDGDRDVAAAAKSGERGVVRTVSSTFLIDRIAEAHGESVREVPVGFKWVAEAMADGGVIFGGEESGGFTVRGHVREKDGVLMALLAAAVTAAEPYDTRVDRLFDAHGEIHTARRNVDCPDDRKDAVLAELEGAVPEAVAGEPVDRVVTLDGFKLLLADGSWVLVRPSGTEPKLRVYAEADAADRAAELAGAGEALVDSLR